MDLGIEGRTALVLGASKGIGRGIATALAREGASVAIASRTAETLERAAAEIEGDVRPFVADTADLERLEGLPGEVEAELGPIDDPGHEHGWAAARRRARRRRGRLARGL